MPDISRKVVSDDGSLVGGAPLRNGDREVTIRNPGR